MRYSSLYTCNHNFSSANLSPCCACAASSSFVVFSLLLLLAKISEKLKIKKAQKKQCSTVFPFLEANHIGGILLSFIVIIKTIKLQICKMSSCPTYTATRLTKVDIITPANTGNISALFSSDFLAILLPLRSTSAHAGSSFLLKKLGKTVRSPLMQGIHFYVNMLVWWIQLTFLDLSVL